MKSTDLSVLIEAAGLASRLWEFMKHEGGVSVGVDYSVDSEIRDRLQVCIRRKFSGVASVSQRKRILFLCTGNSCRSQMAEGLLRTYHGERYEALSAGAKPAGYVHPRAVTVMAELGIDITSQLSKSIYEFLPPKHTPPDVVIGVCSAADENCPTFPAAVERWHWPFDDPFHAKGSEEELMSEFRRVRDEIRARLDQEFGR